MWFSPQFVRNLVCFYVQPIIIVHDANEGSRLEVKNALSKLPYMNRNPAV